MKMKSLSVGEFKAQFSDVIQEVRSGGKIAVTFGKKKEVIGYFVPEKSETSGKRTLGVLEGKASAKFGEDFKMTEEELLSL